MTWGAEPGRIDAMSDLNKQDVQVALEEVLTGLVSDGTAKPRKQTTTARDAPR